MRATFEVLDTGKLRLADVQPPPALAPEYTGEPGASSLRCESDLLYVRPCTDIVANAHAHAPRSQPAEMVTVSLRVASLHKRLNVFGARVYYEGMSGLTTTAPVPFVSSAIVYEAAYGGSDLVDPDPTRRGMCAENPIGKGFALNPERLVGQPAHTIEHGGGTPSGALPAGFGPIDAAWSPRRERAGTYDDVWERRRRPLLPADYDDLYASSAPEDQRIPRYLHGGEPIELSNMTPSGSWRFELPKIHITYNTFFGRRREEHRGNLITVLLLPEQNQVSLVWQSALFVAPQDGDYLDVTRIGEKRYLR